jgi:hypothetical protein
VIDVTAFEFNGSEAQPSASNRVIDVPPTVTTKEEIIATLAKALEVPDYFGANWDALDESLRDLSWVPQRVVSIRHSAVPNLPIDVLRMYLDILARAVRSWKAEENHVVKVSFPASARDAIVLVARGPVAGQTKDRPS